jgi:hypothetical protein
VVVVAEPDAHLMVYHLVAPVPLEVRAVVVVADQVILHKASQELLIPVVVAEQDLRRQHQAEALEVQVLLLFVIHIHNHNIGI